MMIAKTGIALLWVSVLLVLGTSSAFAQSPTTGRIAGTVKDERGALLVGADVTVSSKTTAGERRVATDNQANYAVPLLPPGAYRVTITANGFASQAICANAATGADSHDCARCTDVAAHTRL